MTHHTTTELTAEEARALADDLGLKLYRAEDALAFVGECCDIADREQRPITTAQVREWLKGARCGRQLLAEAVDRADLRDRIAEAALHAVETALGDTLLPAAREEALAGIVAVLPEPADRAAVLLPAWEAVYEPGNVSTYLIGYANDRAAATGMAEAWLRSQAEVTGRLEWLDEQQMATGRHDRWFELIERHDDGVDTGPGIVVRRLADETQPTETEAHQVDVDTLARLMCDADVYVNNGDYPGWDDLSKTPGLGQDEVRKAARYLLKRLHITERTPAVGARQDGAQR